MMEDRAVDEEELSLGIGLGLGLPHLETEESEREIADYNYPPNTPGNGCTMNKRRVSIFSNTPPFYCVSRRG
jgi:hypothetical protein